MSRQYPLAAVLNLQQRRLLQAQAALNAANEVVRQRQAALLQAQEQLEAARCLRAELQQVQAGQTRKRGPAEALAVSALRIAWLQDRVEDCGRHRAAAAAAVDQAQAAAAAAREAYCKALARRDGLIEHRQRWRQQQLKQQLRGEEAVLDELLTHRSVAGA